MVSIAGQLIQKLKQLGPDAVVDMDNAAQRESMVSLRILDSTPMSRFGLPAKLRALWHYAMFEPTLDPI